MKKYAPLAAVVVLVMTGLLLHFSGLATARPQAGSGGSPFAGVFYVDADFNGITLHTISHLNADGTSLLVDMFQFGLGGAFDQGSPSPGIWWHSGPRQVTELRLEFGYTPDGLPARVYRYTSETTFDPTYDTGTGISYPSVPTSVRQADHRV